MGDAADMILEGVVCQACGEFANDNPPGHPVYCSACAGVLLGTSPDGEKITAALTQIEFAREGCEGSVEVWAGIETKAGRVITAFTADEVDDGLADEVHFTTKDEGAIYQWAIAPSLAERLRDALGEYDGALAAWRENKADTGEVLLSADTVVDLARVFVSKIDLGDQT